PVFTGGGADITGGKLALDYSGGGTNPANQVKTILTAGYAQSPTKFATGQIRTSNPADPNKGLGWRDTGSQVIVAYTYYGDANVDGKVNMLDFNAVAVNFGGSAKVWSDGDFNYDGTVNTTDFNMLAADFNQSIAIPASPALGVLVPEPGLIGAAG